MNKKYKIVLLEDTFDSNNKFIEKDISILADYDDYFEGSAYNIIFTPNVNGTKTLEFNVPIYCIDEFTGERELNPRYKFLTNERKVRLFYKNKVYNFLIKNVVETKDDNLSTVLKVTCSDAVVEELSKIGWSTYFDEYNGIGNTHELMSKVLKGSDWIYDQEGSDTFYEEEYLNVDGELNTNEGASQDAPLISYDPKLGRIYHFKGSRKILGLPEAESDEVEILKYTTENFVQSEVGRNLLSYGNNFYTLDGWVQGSSNLSIKTSEGNDYQRYLNVSNTEFFYNKSLDDKNFKFSINEGYTFSITCKSSAATTLIVEIGDHFGETLNQVCRQTFSIPASSAWTTYGFDFVPKIEGKFNRVFLKLVNAVTFDIGKVRVEQGNRNAILNSDFSKGTEHWKFENIEIESEGEEEKITFSNEVLEDFESRIKVLKTNQRIISTDSTTFFKSFDASKSATLSFKLKGDAFGSIKCKIKGIKNGVEDIQETEIKYDITWKDYSAIFKMVSLLPYDSIELILEPSSYIYIDEIKLEKGEKTIWTPALEDEIVFYNYSPVAEFVKKDYYYYYETENLKKDLFLTAQQISTLVPYTGKPEKVRTLKAEKSNTFNLIQEICELFEGWAEFDIAYDENGNILTDELGRRQKKVRIKKDVGRDLPYGIEYGVNLQDIEREINSDEIVTKMYVENNEWEYAKDGIVSITQAEENESKESYIINFDYFIELGLLPQQAKVDIASYNLQMGSINSELEANQTLRNNIQTELSQAVEPQLEVLELQKVALEEALKNINEQLTQMLPEMDVAGLKEQKTNYEQQLNEVKKSMEDLQIKKDKYDAQVEDLTEKINTSIDQKNLLMASFNSKYVSFIREGVWSDENYIEPNQFYRDAKIVCKRSAYPQISYVVSMVNLSDLEDYEHLDINVGDKTYVLDNDLFLKPVDNIYVPQKIDVFVSEIEFCLDNPEETSVRVQNYRSRFDDIFQKVVASTESLKLNEKIYDRSSNFTTDQQINVDILQNSLLNNNLILARSKDNTVVFDSNGITVSDANNPKRQVKIVSGGIFITKDGMNYKAGITPDGVSVDQLTAGLIDTKNIQIWNAEEPRFLWDATGLKAYGVDKDGKADTNSAITFNHEGFIFQRDRKSEKAELSLTWDGLKMYLQDGSVQIGSGAGIVVEDNQVFPVKRVEIGKINRVAGESERFSKDNPITSPIYGMILRNELGQETLITSDNGELWLKRAISVGDHGTENMAGISGATEYSTREIENIIRNEQYIDLEKAIEEGNVEKENEIRKKINSPILAEKIRERKNALESDPIRFWSGANAPTKATFRVHQSGLVYATNAFIEGNITALSGHFKGRVYVGFKKEGENNTGAGISGDKNDSVRIWAGAPFVSGSELESEPEQGLFKVYNSGKVYSTNMDVHGLFSVGETVENEFKPSLFIAGTDYLFDGVLNRNTVEPNLKARLWAGGESPNNANLVITSDGALYSSDIHVSGKIEGEGLKVSKINIDDNGIYTNGFNGNLAGSGWMIRNDGTANFNNVVIRGEISASVFSKNEIQAAGGSLLIRPSTSLTEDIDFTGKKDTIVEFGVEDKDMFNVDDFIQLREKNSIATLKIVDIEEDKIAALLKTESGQFYAGCPIINYGTTGDTGILIAASNGVINNTSGSIIEMAQTEIVDDQLTEKLLLRMGDLSTVPDIDLPNLGYGLAADNVMLRGNVFLPNAGIYSGSERSGGETKVIRFWSGTSFKTRHEANFKVYEDGTVMARNGIFEGKIIASEGGFSGSVGLGGITINDNTGTFEIEKRQGNTDKFNTIASFGTDGITVYDGGLRIFKSLADQSLPKPNTFQYLYPYIFAINDTEGDHERFITREFHIWSFDPEDARNMRMNYSIRSTKDSFVFSQGSLQDQDKQIIKYFIEDFTAEREDNFISYIANPEIVELEKTSSYLGIKQNEPTEQEIARLRIEKFKNISDPNKARQFELIINVEMEYSDCEEGHLIVKYLPRQTSETYELLKYNLPVLKQTKTRLYKDLRISGYDNNNPMELIICVENSTSKSQKTNNRLLIHDISIEEKTNTVVSAEKLAYDLPEICKIGMLGLDSFGATIMNQGKFLINAKDYSEDNFIQVGINTLTPESELDLKGKATFDRSENKEYMSVGKNGSVIKNITKFVGSDIRVKKGQIILDTNNANIENAEFFLSGGNYYIDENTSGVNPNSFHYINKNANFVDSIVPVSDGTISLISNNININNNFKVLGKFIFPEFNNVNLKITNTTPEIVDSNGVKTTTITNGIISLEQAELELTCTEEFSDNSIVTIDAGATSLTNNRVQLISTNLSFDNQGKVITINGEATLQEDGSWLMENVTFPAQGNLSTTINSVSGNINNQLTEFDSQYIVFRRGNIDVQEEKTIFSNVTFDYNFNNVKTNNMIIKMDEMATTSSVKVEMILLNNELTIRNKNFTFNKKDSVDIIKNSSTIINPGSMLISENIEKNIPSIEIYSLGEKGFDAQSSKIIFFNITEEGLRTSIVSTYIEHPKTNETCPGISIWNEYNNDLHQSLKVTGHIFADLDGYFGRDLYVKNDAKIEHDLYVSNELYLKGDSRMPIIKFGTEIPTNEMFPDATPKKGDIYIRY